MSRMVLAQESHIINALPPVDIDGGANTDVISMKDCSHITFLVTLGVTGASTTIKVQECDDFTPTNTNDIAFKVAKEETANGDTLGNLAANASTGVATSTNDNITYVIEVDAEDLNVDGGYNKLRLNFSDPGAATFASVVAVQTGFAYQGDATRTQIA